MAARLSYLIIATLCIFAPQIALADGMGFVMCQAADMVQGQIAAALATIGICALGAGAAFGRVSWTTAIAIAAGIGGMFGAFNIAIMLGAHGYSGNGGCI